MKKIESKTGCIEIANFLDLKLLEEIIDFTNRNLDSLALNAFKNKNLDLINRVINDKKFQKIKLFFFVLVRKVNNVQH